MDAQAKNKPDQWSFFAGFLLLNLFIGPDEMFLHMTQEPLNQMPAK